MSQSLTESFMCLSILISAIKLPTAVPKSLLGATVIHSKPPESWSLSAFNIPSCWDHLCHLHLLWVTMVACKTLTPEGRTPGFVSHVTQSLLPSLTLPMKMNCGTSSHQEISSLSIVRKNFLAAPRSIKSYKPNLWEQNWVCQTADVIPQTLTRVTMAHSAVSWAALNNVRTKR